MNRFGFFGKALMLGAALGFSASTASAAVTQDATFDLKSVTPVIDPVTPVLQLNYSNSGVLLTNTVTEIPGGVGEAVYTVGATVVSSASIFAGPSEASPLVTRDLEEAVVAIFAVKGTVIDQISPTEATALFSEGKIGYFDIAPGSFVRTDPTTWGFDLPPLASLSLASPEAVLPNPLSFAPTAESEGRLIAPVAASDVNTSSVNEELDGFASGTFLGFEAENPDFMSIDTVTGFDETFPSYTEGQLYDVGQTVEFNTVSVPSFLAELNDIAQWGFGDDFATAGTGTATDFTVDFQSPTGDFQANLDIRSIPVASVVPEPMTAGLSLIGLAGLGLASRRRRA